MSDAWFEGYAGQTIHELLALEGKYRIDSLVVAIEQGLYQKASVSGAERFVLAVEALEREVNNGGYRQFFDNSSNEFADVIEKALSAIGCPKTAAITRRAIDARGDEAALSGCDDDYYANDEPIADRLFDWIKRNRAEIRLPG